MGDDLTEHLGAMPPLERFQKSHRMHLVVMTGPERGRVFPLEPGQFILGRSPDHSDIVLEGRGLSRAHARLMVTTGYELLLEDLGSTNGSRRLLLVAGSRPFASHMRAPAPISRSPKPARAAMQL